MTDGELERAATRWRGERRRAIVLESGARLLGRALACAGALAGADRLLAPPRPVRLAAWAAGAAWLLWRLWREGAGPWRAAGWAEVFGAAARAWPATAPMLSSAWALRGASVVGEGTSEELRREHVARASALAASLPSSPLFPWSPSAPARRLLALGLVGLAAAAAAGRGSRARALAPWRDVPLESLVALLPGDAKLDWGASAQVAARRTPAGAKAGLRPAELTLETRGEGGAWRAVAWDRLDGEGASFDTGPLSSPLEYRARWRDLASAPRTLTPVPVPRLKAGKAVVHGSRGPRVFILGEDSPVRARRGDWVTVRGEPEAPLAEAALRVSSLPSLLPMARGEGGTWSAGFTAQEDATLALLLTGDDGRRDPSPPSYALAVAADAKPVVELLSPQVPIQAGPLDAVAAAYEASDDGALTSLELVLRARGRETRRKLAFDPGERALGDAALPLRDYAPGTALEFWFEAADDASPRQTARSASGLVEIVDAEAAHGAALAAREEALAALEAAAQTADAAADAAEKGDAAAAKEAARPLDGRWMKSAERLMAWNRALGEDPRANPGLSEQAAAASESLARAGMEGLPKAAEALSRGDLKEAAREQRALAEQARAAREALKESSRLQAAQDAAERAAAAERGGGDLERALEKLAAGATPEQLAELQKSLQDVANALEDLKKTFDSLPEVDADRKAARDLPMQGAQKAAADMRNALSRGDAAAAAAAAREMAEQLRKLSRELRESGRRSAEEHAKKTSREAQRATQAWKEAEAAQERAVEAARRLEEARRKETLEAQKQLLEKAGRALDDALNGAPSPELAAPARAARAALAAGRVDEAVKLLRAGAAAAKAGAPGFGRALDDEAAALEKGVPPPPPDPSAARGAAEAQAQARAQGAKLRRELGEAAKALGFSPGAPLRRVDDALALEEQGEAALRRGDSAEGLKRGEAALALLQEGGKGAQGSQSSSEGMGQASRQPFGGQPGGSARAAPAGAMGRGVGRVRLPSADEYRPPKELREELERSLREPRPASQSPAIKEYFRRLAR